MTLITVILLSALFGCILFVPRYVVPVYILYGPPPSLTQTTTASTTTIGGFTTTYTTTLSTATTFTGPWTSTTTMWTTTTRTVRAHVADTWAVAEIRFEDGSVRRVESGMLPARLMLQLEYSGRRIKDIGFDVPAVAFPPPPESSTYSYMVAVETHAKILINGRTVYSDGPFLGMPEIQWAPEDYGNLKSTWKLDSFDVNAYVADLPTGSRVTVELYVNQHWWLIRHTAHYVETIGETDVQVYHPLSFNKPSAEQVDFVLSLSPAGVELGKTSGSTKTVSVGLLSVGEFSSPVSLSITGLPAGVSAEFEADTVDMSPGRFSSTSLTLTAGSTAAEGSYTATITATGGGVTHTVKLGVTVVESSTPDQYHPGLFSALSLTVNPSQAPPGAQVEVSGSLTGPSGEGISGRSVYLSSNFNWSATATTDSSGRFSVSLKAPSGEGIYQIKAEFRGDDQYASSSDTATLLVKQGEPWIPPDLWGWLKGWIGGLPPWAKYVGIAFLILIGILVLAAIVAVLIRISRWAKGGRRYYYYRYRPYYRRY